MNKLLKVLNRLTDKGNTIYIIEHNLDVIKNCDYILDLGLEGGDRGGDVITQGTPEQICTKENIKKTKSHTAKYLKDII